MERIFSTFFQNHPSYKAGAAYKIGKSRTYEISLQAGLNTNLGNPKSYPHYSFREVTAEIGLLKKFQKSPAH